MVSIASLESQIKEQAALAQEAQARECVLQAQVAALEKSSEDLKVSLRVAEGRAGNAEDSLRSASENIVNLRVQVEKVKEDSKKLVKKQKEMVKKAEKAARKEMSKQYHAILLKIKEKFEKKRVEVDTEIQVMECKSNILLLNDIISQTITDFEAEKETIEAEKLRLGAELAIVQVSDFSLSKLDLPQVSEDSVTLPAGSSMQVPTDQTDPGSQELRKEFSVPASEPVSTNDPNEPVGE